MRRPLCAFAAAAALLLLFSSTAFSQLHPGDKVPPFKGIQDSDGFAFNSSQFDDRTALIAFFSVYSSTSDALFNFLKSAYRRNGAPGGAGIEVIAVSIDSNEKDVRKLIQKKSPNFKVLLDTSLKLEDIFRVGDVPCFFLIEDMKVKAYWNGYSQSIRKSIESALEKSASSEKNTKKPDSSSTQKLDDRFKEKKIAAADAASVIPCPADSSKILYISSKHVLVHYDADGDKRDELATRVQSASWSPDGRSVVFAKLDNEGIWTKELAGGNTKKIASEGFNPIWAKRDGLIAFIVQPAEIWVHKLSSGKSWRAAADGIDIQWSKDGMLLIVTDARKRVWLVSPYSRHSLLKGG